MTTDGIEAVFLTTHNWGKSAKFFQGLGFELEFDTGHNSGQLRNGDGPYVFIAEIPDQEPGLQIVLKVADEEAFRPGPDVEVVASFTDTHFGTSGDDRSRPRQASLEPPGSGQRTDVEDRLDGPGTSGRTGKHGGAGCALAGDARPR